jgi:hypothetical protein
MLTQGITTEEALKVELEALGRAHPGRAAFITALENAFPDATLQEIAILLTLFSEISRRTDRRRTSFGR